ncbi:NYN domain-containing protein [Paenibacillus yanchengensis]|uniref:NYN domain-containing protein n=1 Tax=Paenibacillus yanchengensis TaxID=2035833 RepID=A0ABW4YH87_9BACL
MKRRADILLVDGYNIIGAWPELNQLKEHHQLEDARDRLLDMLADYQGYTGMEVYVIFDAHQVPGRGATYKQHKLTVMFTKEKETADECIERLCHELYSRRYNIYVATSDLVEQHVAFGQGALRLSARELLNEVGHCRAMIRKKVKEDIHSNKRNTVDEIIHVDVWSKLEQMRRGEK